MDRMAELEVMEIGPHYDESVALRDGTEVSIRVVRPEHRHLLRQGLAQMSPQSRYYRFFSEKLRLSDNELAYLTETDGWDHLALGAVRVVDGEERGLGVGRFIRLPDRSNAAEPAIAVVDDAQGLGLGSLLLNRLATAARERGIDTFCFEVLASNEGAKHLMERFAGHHLDWTSDGAGVMYAEVALGGDADDEEGEPRPILERLFAASARGDLEIQLGSLLLKHLRRDEEE